MSLFALNMFFKGDKKMIKNKKILACVIPILFIFTCPMHVSASSSTLSTNQFLNNNLEVSSIYAPMLIESEEDFFNKVYEETQNKNSSLFGKMLAASAIEDIKETNKSNEQKSNDILKTATEYKYSIFDTINFSETNDIVYPTTSLNVRALPDADSECVGYLSTNQEVKRLGEYDNGWSKILYNDNELYVNSKYISNEKQVIKEQPKKSTSSVSPTISTNRNVSLTQEEYNTLLLLAMSEAGNTSYECTLACVETVLNRIESGFGDFWTVIKSYYINYNKTPNQQCINAVNQALAGNTYPSNMYYFRTNHYHSFGTPYMVIDNVYFSLG